LQQTSPPPPSKPEVGKSKIGFAFSIIGAILILARGIVRMAFGDIVAFDEEIRRRFLAAIALNILGGIAVAFAIIIMVGAYLMYKGMTIVGGAIVIVFSLLSIFAGSGWLLGLVLGLIGGILGLMKK
jgi:hypothetical protein